MVIHTAIWVSDLEATKEFYIDGVGFHHSHDFVGPEDLAPGVTNYYVQYEDQAQIQLRYDPDSDGEIEVSGFDHIAIGVDDTDAEFERIVEETGCPVRVEPTTVDAAGARVAFVEDPDGYALELVESLD